MVQLRRQPHGGVDYARAGREIPLGPLTDIGVIGGHARGEEIRVGREHIHGATGQRRRADIGDQRPRAGWFGWHDFGDETAFDRQYGQILVERGLQRVDQIGTGLIIQLARVRVDREAKMFVFERRIIRSQGVGVFLRINRTQLIGLPIV